MGKEFVIKHGYISKGDSIVSGSLSGETLNLTTTPSNDNSQTQVLVRNNTTGIVEYRDASTFSGASGSNTFVTGFTYNGNNTFTIFDNGGSSFPATIDQVSGLTVNGTLSATTLDGNTILSGGTNLLTIIDDRDDFVTGTTFGSNQAILTRNDGTEVFKLSGSSSVQLTNPSGNKIDIDVTIPAGMNTYVTGFTYDDINTFTITDNLGTAFTANINVLSATTISGGTLYGDGSNLTGIPHTTDTFVSGGTYSDSTDIITFTNTTGGTFNVTGVTDKFVTGGTYNPSTVNLDFSGNSGFSSFSVDVSDLKDDTNTFVTGYTYDNNNTFTISDSTGSAFTATINQVSGLTVNGTLSATTLDGNTILSGGTNLLTIIESLDTYVTGGTINLPATDNTNSGNIGLFYKNPDGISRTLPFEDTYTTGSTYDNGTALATFDRNDDTSYTLDLSTIDVNDTFVTGTTFGSNQAILRRNDGVDVLLLTGGTNVTLSNPSTNQIKFDVTIPSGSNTFVTGFTYDNLNTFTINDNVGSAFTASINVLSATTISATTYYGDGSNLTGVGGGASIRNVTSTDTFAAANETINCTSGTFIVNLPTAIGIQGTTYTLVNSGTGTITLKGALGQTINGSTTIDLKRQHISRTVQSDNSNWIVI